MGDPEGKRSAAIRPSGQFADMPVDYDEEAQRTVSDNLFGNTLQWVRNAARGRHGNSAGSRQRSIICSVPEEFRRRNAVQEAEEHQGYTPVAVQIAAYTLYTCSTDLRSRVDKMATRKWGSLQQLINQHRSPLLEPARTHVLLLPCLARMMRVVPQIPASYGFSNYQSDLLEDLARHCLTNGCFILLRLLKYAPSVEGGNHQIDDEHEWAWQFVARDLLLLQNQLPFFVVRELFHEFRNDNNNTDEEALVTGSLGFLRSFCPELLHSYYPRSDDHHPTAQDIARVDHLLHLFYLFVVPKNRAMSSNKSKTDSSSHKYDHQLLPELPQWIPSAKVLEDSGVRFRRRKGAKSFLDIKFDVRRGILAIPPLQLCNHSDAMFRNLIAFELTCPGIGHAISAYAIFMDCLIKTPEDMRILNKLGILMSKISGDRNDSDFFSLISAHVPMPADNYLAQVMNDVSINRDYRRNKWYTELLRNYCSNPWVAMSVFAAALLLCLTVLQTFFTVYPYYNPRD